MSGQILHVDFFSLRPNANDSERRALAEEAASLAGLPGVIDAGAIEAVPGSDADLVTYFLFQGLGDLELFGTDHRYTAFLQGSIAPLLAGLSGADLRLEGGFPRTSSYAAVLALATAPEMYDWQVRADLEAWSRAQTDAWAVGLAVGERQRYRGVAMAFRDDMRLPLPPAPVGYSALMAAGRVRLLR